MRTVDPSTLDPGCTYCGDDYAAGDAVRVWDGAERLLSMHDRCFLGSATTAAARARNLPRANAAPVITWPFNNDKAVS